jgi:hypothetical protein
MFSCFPGAGTVAGSRQCQMSQWLRCGWKVELWEGWRVGGQQAMRSYVPGAGTFGRQQAVADVTVAQVRVESVGTVGGEEGGRANR